MLTTGKELNGNSLSLGHWRNPVKSAPTTLPVSWMQLSKKIPREERRQRALPGDSPLEQAFDFRATSKQAPGRNCEMRARIGERGGFGAATGINCSAPIR